MKTIPLTQNQVALVDDEDYERVAAFKWCAHRKPDTFYAVRSSSRLLDPLRRQKSIAMHGFIVRAPAGTVVDHRDHNGLNNQRDNLRLCTDALNGGNRRLSSNNTSGYKGVVWNKCCRKWQAQIEVNKLKIYLGLFDDRTAAAHTYNRAALEHFGSKTAT